MKNSGSRLCTSEISVVIPTHNRHGALKQSVRSVFAQSVLPKELIVLDDGSAPPVEESVFQGAPWGLKVLLLSVGTPRGAAAARNVGVEHASGDWIAFLDDDDAFMPEKIRDVSAAICRNPDAGLVYHPAEIRMVRENINYLSGAGSLAEGTDQTRQLLVRNLVGGTSMVVVKRACLLGAGGFDPDLPAIEDHDLWIRLSLKGHRFFFVDKPLTRYHHDTASTSLTHSFEKEETAQALMMRKYAKEYATLNKGEIRAMELHRLRGKAFKALLNRRLGMAFRWQSRAFLHGFRLRDLAGLLVIPFGLKAVFRMRSLGGRSLRISEESDSIH